MIKISSTAIGRTTALIVNIIRDIARMILLLLKIASLERNNSQMRWLIKAKHMIKIHGNP